MVGVTWAAVILTGGTAVRLDGTDKAGLTHAGRSLLEHALDAVAGAAEVAVVGPEVRTSRRVTFTRESPPGGGPLAGIAAGVAVLERDHDLVVVLAVDMPHVTPATVSRLVSAVGDGDSAWLVDASGRRQLAAAVRPALVPAPGAAHGVPARVLMRAGRSTDVPALGDEAADVDTWPDVARLDPARGGDDRPDTGPPHT
jgi:molybdopterin-guanine dinucleotide biosynthesis protein A